MTPRELMLVKSRRERDAPVMRASKCCPDLVALSDGRPIQATVFGGAKPRRNTLGYRSSNLASGTFPHLPCETRRTRTAGVRVDGVAPLGGTSATGASCSRVDLDSPGYLFEAGGGVLS